MANAHNPLELSMHKLILHCKRRKHKALCKHLKMAIAWKQGIPHIRRMASSSNLAPSLPAYSICRTMPTLHDVAPRIMLFAPRSPLANQPLVSLDAAIARACESLFPPSNHICTQDTSPMQRAFEQAIALSYGHSESHACLQRQSRTSLSFALRQSVREVANATLPSEVSGGFFRRINYLADTTRGCAPLCQRIANYRVLNTNLSSRDAVTTLAFRRVMGTIPVMVAGSSPTLATLSTPRLTSSRRRMVVRHPRSAIIDGGGLHRQPKGTLKYTVKQRMKYDVVSVVDDTLDTSVQPTTTKVHRSDNLPSCGGFNVACGTRNSASWFVRVKRTVTEVMTTQPHGLAYPEEYATI